MNKKNKKEINYSVISYSITFLVATFGTMITYILINKPMSNNANNQKRDNVQQTLENNEKIITNKNPTENKEELINQQVKTSINFINQDEKYSLEDKIINLAKQRNLPVDKLSFSLINFSEYSCPQIKENNSLCYISYQDKIPRYPASIVKLFWMVLAYQQNPNPNEELNQQLQKMIIDSDNEASSMVVDVITNTKSSAEKLPNQEFQQWKNNRDYLNKYFNTKGFNNINISQKTFPIPYINMDMPEGADLQLRHPNGEEKPIRNYFTSYSVALLLFQIYDGKYFNASDEMLLLLNRDLKSSAWQDIPYNAIDGFLGQGIPDKNAQFYSKMGWTFSNRNDSIIVISPDQKVRYIFVILGDDSAFYEDKTFYPEVSKLVYEEMIK